MHLGLSRFEQIRFGTQNHLPKKGRIRRLSELELKVAPNFPRRPGSQIQTDVFFFNLASAKSTPQAASVLYEMRCMTLSIVSGYDAYIETALSTK